MSSPSDAEVIRRSLGEPEAVHAALSFLDRAFGFREIRSSRMEGADGMIHHANVEFGGSVIGIGTQGAHGAVSPKSAGIASQYVSVYVDDIDAHYERALAAGAQIPRGPRDHAPEYRAYEALDLEGHRWRFVQWMQAVPPSEQR
jgi:uncharacterized glyoxalase superfamily protein PhnB